MPWTRISGTPVPRRSKASSMEPSEPSTAPRGNLNPDRFPFPGRSRSPAFGELVHQVESPAALVVLPGAPYPGQPEILVEDLDPDRLLAPAQPEDELLVAGDLVLEPRHVPGVLER